MKLIPLPAFQDNYLWVLHDGHRALVVDPGDAQPVLGFLAAHRPATRGDSSHAPPPGPHRRRGAAARSHRRRGVRTGARSHPGTAAAPVAGRQRSRCWACASQVIDVPGHTAGHIAYFTDEDDGGPLLFCGDTLFSGGCGRLFEGTPAQMLASLDALAALPDATRVCCAHEYTLSNLRFARAVEPGNEALAAYQRHCEDLRARGEPTLPSIHRRGKAHQPLPAQPRARRGPAPRRPSTAPEPRMTWPCSPPCASGRTSSDESPAAGRRPGDHALAGRLRQHAGHRRPLLPRHQHRRSARHRGQGAVRPGGGTQRPAHRRSRPSDATSRSVAALQPPADLWERIRRGFAMPDLDTDLVRQHEQWYASRPDYMQRMTDRSRKYLFHIVEELERRGMPTELALLPFIESAFNPQAVSSARAAGMWQFMPATGRDYDLQAERLPRRPPQRAGLDPRRARLPAAPVRHVRRLAPRAGRLQLGRRQRRTRHRRATSGRAGHAATPT